MFLTSWWVSRSRSRLYVPSFLPSFVPLLVPSFILRSFLPSFLASFLSFFATLTIGSFVGSFFFSLVCSVLQEFTGTIFFLPRFFFLLPFPFFPSVIHFFSFCFVYWRQGSVIADFSLSLLHRYYQGITPLVDAINIDGKIEETLPVSPINLTSPDGKCYPVSKFLDKQLRRN